MAGMFYSLEETAEKLGISVEEIEGLVTSGRLRKFADGANELFKVDEVESLMSEMSAMSSASPAGEEEDVELSLSSDEGELSLAEEPELSLSEPSEEGESFDDDIFLASDEVEASKPDSSSDVLGIDLSNDDTAVVGEGLNVLGDETDQDQYSLTDDTMSETSDATVAEASLEEIEESVNLDTFGSGSGLLDLSLQADDTSLGGILDEIYTPDGSEGEEPSEGSALEVAAEADMLVGDGIDDSVEPMGLEGGAVVTVAAEAAPDKASGIFGFMLFLPLLVVIYTVAVMAVISYSKSMPMILGEIKGILWYIMGGIAGLAIILGIAGGMSGSGGSGKKPKKKKVKAPKKPKEKKPKKEKKKKAKKK